MRGVDGLTTRTFRIGASGHRDLGDEEARQFAVQSVRALLSSYSQRYPDLVLCAPLAIGADQLCIQTALDLHIPVEAALPSEQYETHYASEEELETYRRLLRQCRAVHIQPFPAPNDDAYLANGQWIVDHSDLVFLIWNGQPSGGRGGTADIASHAWRTGCPFIHIHHQKQQLQTYGDIQHRPERSTGVKREEAVSTQLLYCGPILTVHQYRFRTNHDEEIIRDIVERPESVLIVPVNTEGVLTLIEEYDLGAGTWQLKLPGGKLQFLAEQDLGQEVQRELREELGYRAGHLEPLLHIHSHPGYVAHKVHVVVASELEWDPLPLENHEEIRTITYPLAEALAETMKDYRCDPEAALALWIYARKQGFLFWKDS